MCLTCIMVRINPQELRQRAGDYRLLSAEGDDWHLKVALLQLADEFDLEASEIEGRDLPQPCPISPHGAVNANWAGLHTRNRH
jgi:hypothetical protein